MIKCIVILSLFLGWGCHFSDAISSSTSFPTVKGKTLAGKRVTFPRDYRGKYSFVLLGFQEHHKGEAEGWIDFFESQFSDQDAIGYFAVPMIGPGFLNFIKYQVIRKNVLKHRYPYVMVYPKRLSLILKPLSVKIEDHLLLYLLNEESQIIWSAVGALTPEKQSAFYEHVNHLRAIPTANEVGEDTL